MHPTQGIRYYHFDELGSTRLLTDSNGAVTDRYAYDAYGAVLAHDRLAGSVDQPYQYVGRLGYYTHYQEPEFGLLQLGVRFYDPEVGRFTQRDPLHGLVGFNDYQYANSAPLSAADPAGLVAVQINPGMVQVLQARGKCITISTWRRQVWRFSIAKFVSAVWESVKGSPADMVELVASAVQAYGECSAYLQSAPADKGLAFVSCMGAEMTSDPDFVTDLDELWKAFRAGFYKPWQYKSIVRCYDCTGVYQNELEPIGGGWTKYEWWRARN